MRLALLTRNGLHGVHGGFRYLAALATGDMADDETVTARRALCRECPSRVRRAAIPGIEESDWCGSPLHDGKTDAPPTCGCLCAGKTAVGSEHCPQAKW